MKNVIIKVVAGIIVIALIVMGIVSGFSLDELQKETLLILVIVTLISILYCFIVGEITLNYSQMDKLWSVLPIIYAWIIAIKGGLSFRLIIMAILISIWGIRLTFNFARKGAYSIKFWSGEEDYRWVILRKNPHLNKRWKWAIFDLFFISIYQNLLVLGITLPMLAVMSSDQAFNYMDMISCFVMLAFIAYEAIADEQQMSFQKTKWAMLNEGKSLNDLPSPYNKGFNTTGLWKYSRHPNYFAEQAIWISLYTFTIGAYACQFGVFNWTIIFSMLLVLLFIGSSSFAENISKSKYSEYENYQNKVFKYLPLRKYK